jgi:pimeloyl-ACP methyl ester carboxylesterase
MRDAASHRGGNGTPLVCLHGFSDTWRAWAPVLDALEAEHDVLALTLPGHFCGPALPDGVVASIPAAVDLLERVLDDAGLTTAHLVGNSFGGWMALELAARGRARSVVALAPAGGWDRGTREDRRVARAFALGYRLARLAAPRADRLMRRPRLRAWALREVVTHPERVPPAAAAHMIRGAADCPIYLPMMRALRRDWFPLELAVMKCPVRIAWGSHDRVIPLQRYSMRFRTLVPDAEWVTLPGVGHIPMHDDPALVVRTILEVTRRVDAPRAAGASPPSGRPAGG